MQEICSKIKVQRELNLPFVIYKKPNQNRIVGYFQQNDHLYFVKNFSEKGFIMAPFDNLEGIILFPEKESEIIQEEFLAANYRQENFSEVLSETSKVAQLDFELLVKKSLEAIKKGIFLKVVVSRKEKVFLGEVDEIQLFQKMANLYPNAFVYCWYHPKVGIWMGASPERLIEVKGKHFHSVSLAGTRALDDSTQEWQHKEKEEQKFVTDYILDNLKNITTQVEVSSPYTTKAGSLLHIKTDIEGELTQESDLKQIINVLHPTPAVCGLPKWLAKDFILENEIYDREFYTGFLGELNKDFTQDNPDTTDLYVNLRCMKIKNKEASLYMGCGITQSSIPEKEYAETVNKSYTMKAVIQACKE